MPYRIPTFRQEGCQPDGFPFIKIGDHLVYIMFQGLPHIPHRRNPGSDPILHPDHTLIHVVQIPVFRFHEQTGEWCPFQYLKKDGNLAAWDRVLIDDRTARGSFIAVLAVQGNIRVKCQSLQQVLRFHLQEMAARRNEQPYPRIPCPVKGMSGIL